MIGRVVLCLVVACLVAGCTPDPLNDGGSTSTTSISPTITMPSISMPPLTSLPPEPPPVTRPLDASRYASEATVCDLLTDIQARRLGLPSPVSSNRIGEGSFLTCNRNRSLSDDKRYVEYNLWPDADLLLSVFGRHRDSDEDYLLDIAGQPAVVNGSDPEPACLVTVGIAARQGIEVMAGDKDNNACALAVAVAEQMVRNLGG